MRPDVGWSREATRRGAERPIQADIEDGNFAASKICFRR
jgi:hypothetical protein